MRVQQARSVMAQQAAAAHRRSHHPNHRHTAQTRAARALLATALPVREGLDVGVDIIESQLVMVDVQPAEECVPCLIVNRIAAILRECVIEGSEDGLSALDGGHVRGDVST